MPRIAASSSTVTVFRPDCSVVFKASALSRLVSICSKLCPDYIRCLPVYIPLLPIKGFDLSRPRASAKQQVRAYQLWRSGMTQRAIQKALETEFREPVSKSTVGNWAKEFQAYRSDGPDPDIPFAWSRMDKYGIPWETSRFVLDYLRASKQHTEDQPPLTFRQVKWAYRVWEATGRHVHFLPPEVPQIPGNGPDDMGWREVGVLAYMLAGAEEASDVLGIENDLAGIDEYIARRPWESLDTAMDYWSDVQTGGARSYESDSSFLTTFLSAVDDLDRLKEERSRSVESESSKQSEEEEARK
jgi:hypothetical protein